MSFVHSADIDALVRTTDASIAREYLIRLRNRQESLAGKANEVFINGVQSGYFINQLLANWERLTEVM